MSSQWIWSPEHSDYYSATNDQYGQTTYVFARQLQPSAAVVAPSIAQPANNQPGTPRIRQDSPQDSQQLLSPITPSVQGDPNFISRYADGGLTTRLGLDESYYVRQRGDTRRFFVVGRVFAMLYTEAAGAQSPSTNNDDAYSYVRFGEVVYSQIRRFIVVEVRHGFVYACAISTYSGRGTAKPGCNPEEHAIAYFPGTDTRYCYLEGEYPRMNKEPIEIMPANDNTLQMNTGSRIRFSKTYPVEMNVKVKDVGQVNPHHLSKLLRYVSQYRF